MKLFAFAFVIFLVFLSTDFEEEKEAPDIETLNAARSIDDLSFDERKVFTANPDKVCFYPILINDLYRKKETHVRTFFQRNEGDEWIKIHEEEACKREEYQILISKDGLYAIAFEAEDCQTLVLVRVRGLNIRQEVIGYGE